MVFVFAVGDVVVAVGIEVFGVGGNFVGAMAHGCCCFVFLFLRW